MRPVNLEDLADVSRRLNRLRVKFAFTGGAIVGFLLDNPRLPFPRSTDDVDAIVEVSTRMEYTDMEETLRLKAGFEHDTSEGAPLCRWIVDGVKVDVMPMRDSTGHFSDRWFEYALETSALRELQGVTIPTVSATCLVATKLVAFHDRGHGDLVASHDIEDILAVVDGRKTLCNELSGERSDLREYVAGTIAHLMSSSAFLDTLPGHLLPDPASQGRLPLVVERLGQIAALCEKNDDKSLP